ncbi:hypothetical protein WICMUC_005246 [Wickerhamomyces mucosus]|uniref:DUF3020 domain-containing protein n=1 Tax=Wickerhamomyces mucosus TaxID=1378264 RepID=A0A9P8T6I0_9ASCO|nr:hypothetical protein WICMUC_005246 [Wickerhamomyces mucosus]
MSDHYNEDDLASVVQQAMEGLEELDDSKFHQNTHLAENHQNIDISTEQVNDSHDFEKELQRKIEEQFHGFHDAEKTDSSKLKHNQLLNGNNNKQNQYPHQDTQSQQGFLPQHETHNDKLFEDDEFAQEVERQLQEQLNQAVQHHEQRAQLPGQTMHSDVDIRQNTRAIETNRLDQDMSNQNLSAELVNDNEKAYGKNALPFEGHEQQSQKEQLLRHQEVSIHENYQQGDASITTDLQNSLSNEYDKELQKHIMEALNEKSATSETSQVELPKSEHIKQQTQHQEEPSQQKSQQQEEESEALQEQPEAPQEQPQEQAQEQKQQPQYPDTHIITNEPLNAFEVDLKKQIMNVFAESDSQSQSHLQNHVSNKDPAIITRLESKTEHHAHLEQDLQKQIMDAFSVSNEDQGISGRSFKHVQQTTEPNTSNNQPHSQPQSQPHSQPHSETHSQSHYESYPTADPAKSDKPNGNQRYESETVQAFDTNFDQDLHNQILEAFGQNTEHPVQEAQPQRNHALEGQHEIVETDYSYKIEEDDPYKNALAELVQSVVDSHIENQQTQQQAQDSNVEDEDIDMNQIMQNALAMAVEDPNTLLQNLNINEGNEIDNNILLGQLLQQQADQVAVDQTPKPTKKKAAKEKKAPKEKKPRAPRKAAKKKKEQAAVSQIPQFQPPSALLTPTYNQGFSSKTQTQLPQPQPQQLQQPLLPLITQPQQPKQLQAQQPPSQQSEQPQHQQPQPQQQQQQYQQQNQHQEQHQELQQQQQQQQKQQQQKPHFSKRDQQLLQSQKQLQTQHQRLPQFHKAFDNSSEVQFAPHQDTKLLQTPQPTALSSGQQKIQFQPSIPQKSQQLNKAGKLIKSDQKFPKPAPANSIINAIKKTPSLILLSKDTSADLAKKSSNISLSLPASAHNSTQTVDNNLQKLPLQSTQSAQSHGSNSLPVKKLSIAETLALSRSNMSSGKFSTKLQESLERNRQLSSQLQSSTSTKLNVGADTVQPGEPHAHESESQKIFRPQIPLHQIKQMMKNADTSGMYSYDVSQRDKVPSIVTSTAQPNDSTHQAPERALQPSLQSNEKEHQVNSSSKPSTPEPTSLSNPESAASTPSSTPQLPVAPGTQGNAILNNISALLPNLPGNLTSLISTAISNALSNNLSQQKEIIKHPKRKPLLNKNETPEEQKERIKIENRERKKRWRDANRLKNQNNDLRARLKKRAIQLFGQNHSEKKTEWIEQEFEKRKNRRMIRSANLEDLTSIINNTLSKLNTDSLSDANITKVISDLVNNALAATNHQALHSVKEDSGSSNPAAEKQVSNNGGIEDSKDFNFADSQELTKLQDDSSNQVGDLELGELLQASTNEITHTLSSNLPQVTTEKRDNHQIGQKVDVEKNKVNQLQPQTQESLTRSLQTHPDTSSQLELHESLPPASITSMASQPSHPVKVPWSSVRPPKRTNNALANFDFKRAKISLIPISKSLGPKAGSQSSLEKVVINTNENGKKPEVPVTAMKENEPKKINESRDDTVFDGSAVSKRKPSVPLAVTTLQRPPTKVPAFKKEAESNGEDLKSSKPSSTTSSSSTVKQRDGESNSTVITEEKSALSRPKFGMGIKKPGAFHGLRKPGAFARPVDREKKRVNV